MENWRFIEANSDYMISDHGRILSFKGKSKLIISSTITSKGYEYVAIRQKGIYVGYSVHRLVATAFIPNPKRLPQVNHLDGNKLNNHVANLEWCDAYDNIMHAIRTGLRPSSPALSPVPCATTDEAGNILQAYPSMNALVKGEQMSPKQRNWLVLHLLHPERLKQSAMKKKPRAERSGSENCFLIAPEIPLLPVTVDSVGEFEAGNSLGIGKSSNSVEEFEAGNPLGVCQSSNSVEEFEAGNPLGIGKSSNSVEEFEAGNPLGIGKSRSSVEEFEAGNPLGVCQSSNSVEEFEAGNPLGIGKSSSSVGQSEAGNPLGIGKSSNSVEEFETGNPLGIGKSSNSVEQSEAGNPLGIGKSRSSVEEFEAGNPLGIGKSSNSIGEFKADNPLGVCQSSNSVEEFEAGNPLGIGKSSNSIGEFEAGNVCVRPVSFSFVSSPFPLISLFDPIHHSVTQHYYRRLSPEESAGFGFNTYVLPRQRKEILQ